MDKEKGRTLSELSKFKERKLDKVKLSSTSLYDLFTNTYILPNYQRYYDWEEEHVTELVEDILKLSTENKEVCDSVINQEDFDPNKFQMKYLGALILQDDRGSANLQIIDGQQRMTTLVFLISVLENIFSFIDTEVSPSVIDKKYERITALLKDEILAYKIKETERTKESSDFKVNFSSGSQTRVTVRKVMEEFISYKRLAVVQDIYSKYIKLIDKLEKQDDVNEWSLTIKEIEETIFRRKLDEKHYKNKRIKRKYLQVTYKTDLFPDPRFLTEISDRIVADISDKIFENDKSVNSDQFSDHISRMINSFIVIYEIITTYIKDNMSYLVDSNFFNNLDAVKDVLRILFAISVTTLRSVWFTKFTIPEDQNAWEIFETINSTGKSLEQSDLVKYALVIAERQKVTEQYIIEGKWDELVGRIDGLLDRGKGMISLRDLCYYHFLSKYPVVDDKVSIKTYGKYLLEKKDIDPIEYIEELATIVDVFDMIINGYYKHNNETVELQTFHILWGLLIAYQKKNIFPLLFRIILSNHLNPSYCIFQLLESIVLFEFATKQLSPTKLLDYSIFILKETDWESDDVESAFIDSFCISIKDNILPPILSLAEMQEIYRTKVKFTSKEVYRIYALITDVIDFSDQSSIQKQLFTFGDEITVEHIYPQKPKSGWDHFSKLSQTSRKLYLSRLGNMTILLQKTNVKLGNKSFDEKIKVYEKEDITVSKSLSHYKEWNNDTIDERTDKVVEVLYNILHPAKVVSCGESLKFPGSNKSPEELKSILEPTF